MKFDFRWLKLIVIVAQALEDGKITKDEAMKIFSVILSLFLPE